MILAKCQLFDLLWQIKHARYTILPIVLLLFTLPEVLAETVDGAIRISNESHARICRDFCSVGIQH